jgi:16S rRNA (uracil1498-N3)-methyltransferase
MRTSRLYFEGLLTQKATVILDRDSSHYLANVLRKKVGSAVTLFNSNDGEFLGTILTAKKHSLTITLKSKVSPVIEEPLKIHLAASISKGDRMDYLIQKSVELGVSEITPIFSEFSEVKIKDKVRLHRKCLHWQRIAKSACEQCGRFFIPLINGPVKFNEFVKNEKDPILLDPAGKENLKSIKRSGEVCLITGPEGGFSPNEIETGSKERTGGEVGAPNFTCRNSAGGCADNHTIGVRRFELNHLLVEVYRL